MKELEIKEPDKLSVGITQQQTKQKKFDTLKPKNGHKCFELDLATGEITEAKYESINADYISAKEGSKSVHKKVITKDTCLYTTALNIKNADKKFVKMLLASIQDGGTLLPG